MAQKLNGLVKWIMLFVMISSMVVTFIVRAALVEQRLDNMYKTHDKDIGYVREDLTTIKEDVKKILERL